MDTSSPNGTVVFDRDDHPSHDNRITFIEWKNGDITVFQANEKDELYSRLDFLSEYVRWRDTIDFGYEYSKAIDTFFRIHFTESEWTLAALSIP